MKIWLLTNRYSFAILGYRFRKAPTGCGRPIHELRSSIFETQFLYIHAPDHWPITHIFMCRLRRSNDSGRNRGLVSVRFPKNPKQRTQNSADSISRSMGHQHPLHRHYDGPSAGWHRHGRHRQENYCQHLSIFSPLHFSISIFNSSFSQSSPYFRLFHFIPIQSLIMSHKINY